MSQNLHRIMGSRFVREKPGLCHNCVHRKAIADPGWNTGFDYLCAARQQIISAPRENARRGRCEHFLAKNR